jgi:hypothetical protein
MTRFWPAKLVGALLFMTSHARAEAKIIVRPTGIGSRDRTQVEPVGGNPGTTLGEQRVLALQHAADTWGRWIDSNVPIEVAVAFEPMGCHSDSVILASTTTADLVAVSGSVEATPGILYHAALANRLAGRDLVPGPEIEMSFNVDVDDTCRDPFLAGFYYGFDGRVPLDQIDAVETALHELAHGLGFQSFTDRESGENELYGDFDAFSVHVHDLETGRDWPALNASQRAASIINGRRLVWNGSEVQKEAPRFLQAGTPSLSFSPRVPGFSGGVSDTGFGANPALSPVNAEVVAFTPPTSCTSFTEAEQRIALVDMRDLVELAAPACRLSTFAKNAQEGGVLGLLLVWPSSADNIASPLPELAVSTTLPVLTLTEADGAALIEALARGRVNANMAGDPSRLLGADEQGRVLLYTPAPVAVGSSVSHFDASARPDLLMEPFSSGGAPHRADLTLALLRDMGWRSLCGNGVIDFGETCDAAQGNSDVAGAPCRLSCLLPGCGDGILDSGEACDSGRDNSDTTPDVCRRDCRPARCGDGVLDALESCDEGARNADRAPATCSTRCGPVTSVAVLDAGGAMTCEPNCMPALDAAVPATEVATDPKLTDWGPAMISERKRHDQGCGLAPGPRPLACLANLAMVLFAITGRRRQGQRHQS